MSRLSLVATAPPWRLALGDPGTMDVFSKFVQIHEKHEWWARDMLRTGDGLSA